jgi:hypothetical protein
VMAPPMRLAPPVMMAVRVGRPVMMGAA